MVLRRTCWSCNSRDLFVNLQGGAGGNFGYGYVEMNVTPNDIITYYMEQWK